MSRLQGTDAWPIHLEPRWCDSIDEVSSEDWSRCFPEVDVRKSYYLQKAVEASRLNGVTYHYLCIEAEGRIVALIPCFTLRISLTTIAPKWVNQTVAKIRRYFPGFLFVDTFVAGTPIAVCESLIGIDRGVIRSPQSRSLLFDVINSALIGRSTSLGFGLVIVKEFSRLSLREFSPNLFRHFCIAESPATTFLHVGAGRDRSYMSRLRNDYRSAMRIRMRKFRASGLRWERSYDFSRYADRMHEIYLQVRSRSSVQFETLTPQFFGALSDLAERKAAFVLLCFDGDLLVAFELFLCDDDNIYPIYLGMDYRYRDSSSLYFNCLYRIIQEAEDAGRHIIELGQTSYHAKSLLGAVASRLYIAVRHNNKVLHFLISLLKDLIFPPTQIPQRHRTFKSPLDEFEALKASGIDFVEDES